MYLSSMRLMKEARGTVGSGELGFMFISHESARDHKC
jgi:hypothetical protein